MEKVIDKAGEKYWSEVWKSLPLPAAINLDDKSIINHINLRYHDVFNSILKTIETKDKKIIEVGCGNSVWLPYFHSQFGMQTDGLDYSEFGCQQSRNILKRENNNGEIYQGDLFNPPAELIGKYDFVLSMGVIEHFSDTNAVVAALLKFIKPGGYIITSLPNHNGILGWIVKTFNRPLYNIHYIIDKVDIEKAYKSNNVNLSFSNYILCPSFFLNLDQFNGKLEFIAARKLAAKILALLSLTLIYIDKKLFRLPNNKTLSPAILSFGKHENKNPLNM